MRILLVSLLLPCTLMVGAGFAQAQSNPCPTLSSDLRQDIRSHNVICTVPQIYGPAGLVFSDPVGPVFGGGSQAPGGTVTFSKQDILTSLNVSVASQIALLPFVSPSSGITFTFDKSIAMYTESQDSFGPIFSERASTIGRHRLAVGFSYQYMNFDSLDGINLHNFPTVNLQDGPHGSNGACSLGTNDTGQCAFIRDYIKATNTINLKIHQMTPFVTFGLTKRLDVSVAIPVLDVSMSATSNAVVVANSAGGGSTGFAAQTWFNHWDPTTLTSECFSGNSPGCLQQTFSNARSSSGLGDITVRAKGTVWKGERSGIGLGLDVRVPTGDERNFLGAGAYGIKPFAVWSYEGRFSPHINLGYEWNGKSVLASPDITTGVKSRLPSDLLYNVGVEAAILKRLTATLDLIGQRVFDANQVRLTEVMAPGSCLGNPNCTAALPPVPETTIAASTGSYGINNAALGVRFRPFGKLLLTANVQLKLDNGGLRSNYVPLVSATYTFR